MAYVNHFFTFFKLFFNAFRTDCFSPFFHFHCTRGVDLCFSLIFIPKAIAGKGGVTQATSLYHQLITAYM